MTGPARIVLHAHSVWSYDGSWQLPALARLFGRFGVDAVMMSEHDSGFDPARWPEYRAACAAASTAACTLVPGIEYSSPDNDTHILTWGLDRYLGEHRPVTGMLAEVREAGGVAVFAHPKRREAWKKFDPDWTALLDGMEIWNRKTDGVAPGAEAIRLIGETGLPALTGVDFHTLRQLWPLDHLLAAGEGDIEARVVGAIRAGKLVPHAYRYPLFRDDGGFRKGFHGALDGVRRVVRDTVGRFIRPKNGDR